MNPNVAENEDGKKKIIPRTSRNGHKPKNKINVADNGNRIFRKTKRKGKYHLVVRNWVTREDPFKEIRSEIVEAFDQNPNLGAKSLFCDIQKKYPDRYQDGQLRTLQRRVKKLRMKQIKKITEEIGIILEPETV